MNSKLVRLGIEGIVCVAVAMGLSYLPQPLEIYFIDFAILPLVFFALRQGSIPSIVMNIIFASVHLALKLDSSLGISEQVLDLAVPYILVFVAGFFARNTVRTAFNVRLSATRLNIITASFFASLAVWAIHALASSLTDLTTLAIQQTELWLLVVNTWETFVFTWFFVAIVLLILLKVNRTYFIPKDTRFLSRREKSHLLND